MDSRRDHALLYDDDCGFCKLCVRGMLRLDRDERLLPVSIQSEEGQRLLTEVPEADRLASMHLVTPGGVVLSGGAALPLISKLLPGGTVPSRAMRRFQPQTDATYRWVAGHRSLFGRLGIRSRRPIDPVDAP
ncbi:MAG: DCC1-like thiol-disulfide oxidoreductase family protein [Solirubrobacterales bacterium]